MEDIVYSPLKGRAVALSEVKDEMFSQKMLGDGVAVYPEFKTGFLAKSEPIYAPCNGEITMVFDEKHAIGIKTESGNEILIHMGIDTVELKGVPFDISCKVGDRVKQGEKIGQVNWKQIAKAGKDTVVPIICTDSKAELEIQKDQGEVNQTTPLYQIR